MSLTCEEESGAPLIQFSTHLASQVLWRYAEAERSRRKDSTGFTDIYTCI